MQDDNKNFHELKDFDVMFIYEVCSKLNPAFMFWNEENDNFKMNFVDVKLYI